VLAAPILPGINDKPGELEALVSAAKAAHARWLMAGVVFLMPSTQKAFLPMLEREFPHLARRYQQWYGRKAYAPAAYRRQIAIILRRLRSKYRIPSRPPHSDFATTPGSATLFPPPATQLTIPF